MGILGRSVANVGKWLLRASGTLRDPALISLLGGTPSEAGVSVNEKTALGFAAVWAAVNQISTGCARLPLLTYRQKGRGKERAPGHPLYPILHDRANPETSSLGFRETLFGHALTWGNGFAEIERDIFDRPKHLWNLRPEWCRLIRHTDHSLWLVYDDPQHGEAKIPYKNVFHIRGLGHDGLLGYSPIKIAKTSLSVGLAAERYGARFFGSGARPSGVITHPKVIGDKAMARLQADFERIHAGLSNSHRVAVLEEGAEYKPYTLPPDEAQFIETRKFSVKDVARIFNIPPHKLRDLEDARQGNLEQENTTFLHETLLPWLIRFEQEAFYKLLMPEESRFITIEHLLEGMLRADQAIRYAAYAIGRNWGFLSANDCRAFENMSPIDGGDNYLQPLNMTPLGVQLGGATAPPSNPAAMQAQTNSFLPFLQQLVRHLEAQNVQSNAA